MERIKLSAVLGAAHRSNQMWGRCWGTKSGGYDSVRKLEKMDHKPQGFETKLERRWRWGKKGPWLSRVWLRRF